MNLSDKTITKPNNIMEKQRVAIIEIIHSSLNLAYGKQYGAFIQYNGVAIVVTGNTINRLAERDYEIIQYKPRYFEITQP